MNYILIYIFIGLLLMLLYEAILGITNDNLELKISDKILYIIGWPFLLFRILINLIF